MYSYTATSIPFANSYTQRSAGINALYWNPANINKNSMNNEFMLFPLTYGIENNSLNLNLFNRIFGNYEPNDKYSHFDDVVKKDLIDNIGRRTAIGLNFNLVNLGYSYKNWAFATATNVSVKGRIDGHYTQILIQGNKYNKAYKFTNRNSNFLAVAYQDITVGYGGYLLNPMIERYYTEYLPPIYGGISISALRGFGAAEMVQFSGEFLANDNVDGLTLNQILTMHSGTNGSGFKIAVGLTSEVYTIDDIRNITAGFSVDNIWGRINWTKELRADSYEAVDIRDWDINNLGDSGMFDAKGDTTYTINKFHTTLPTVFRIGGKYTHSQKTNLSMDIKYSHYISDGFYYYPEISFGYEYNMFDSMPLQLGYRIPWGEAQAIYSFGLGLRMTHYEIGFGYQNIHGFFTHNTKGVVIATYMRWRF